MTFNEMESLLETVKGELSLKAVRADAEGKYYLGAVERVVSIALDRLTVARLHEERKEPIEF